MNQSRTFVHFPAFKQPVENFFEPDRDIAVMTSNKRKYIAEIIALSAVVASLIVVAIEFRH